ncbi:MAG: hypothetical protein ACOCZ6_04100 [Nanoarchaeota archaeon]
MPWKATGEDMGLHDKYCYALDQILEGMEELDDKAYWCITRKFHDYMDHAVYENEKPLVDYLYDLHNEGIDTFDLLGLYDVMRKSITDLLPDIVNRQQHDYTNSEENLYTMILSTSCKHIYTTISRN